MRSTAAHSRSTVNSGTPSPCRRRLEAARALNRFAIVGRDGGLSADVAARLEIVDSARAICLGVRGVANLIPPTQIRLADFSLVRAMSPSTV
jgi:hypothetical protein